MNIEQDPFGREYRSGRLSDEETARRMMDTALAKVHAEGLPISFDALRYEDVIAEAGVARTAAYRRWPTKQHFYADLLLALAGAGQHPIGAAYDAGTIELVRDLAVASTDQLRTSAGRRTLMIEFMRLGALQYFDSLAGAHSWFVYVTLLATLDSLPDNTFRARLQAALHASEEGFLSRMAGFYDVMLEVLGYRIRPDLEEVTTLTLAKLGAAVVEGLTLNNSADPDTAQRRFLIDPFGTDHQQDWSLPGLGFASIILSMVEPAPGSADEWSKEEVTARVQRLQQLLPG